MAAVSRAIRLFPFLEGAAFVGASLVHFGVLAGGYEHRKAGVAESVIGGALLAGFALTWIRPESARRVSLAVQAFALFGTLVGVFAIAIGVGPRTAPDLVYHVVIVAALVWGLIVTFRATA